MLKKYLRKNIDLIVLILVGGLIYAAGWQAEVFGFVQRGILATGLLDAQVEKVDSVQKANLNFQIYDVEGQMIHAESLRGKTVFINFWATWCPPCLAEMPGIEKLYEQMKDDEDVVFLMISVDENREKARMFKARKSLKFPIYFPADNLFQDFKYQSIPATFVIDPTGTIVYRREGMADYGEEDFASFLKNL